MSRKQNLKVFTEYWVVKWPLFFGTHGIWGKITDVVLVLCFLIIMISAPLPKKNLWLRACSSLTIFTWTVLFCSIFHLDRQSPILSSFIVDKINPSDWNCPWINPRRIFTSRFGVFGEYFWDIFLSVCSNRAILFLNDIRHVEERMYCHVL